MEGQTSYQLEPVHMTQDRDNEWEVDYIVNSCLKEKKLGYLIHWKGYDDSDHMWELSYSVHPPSHLQPSGPTPCSQDTNSGVFSLRTLLQTSGALLCSFLYLSISTVTSKTIAMSNLDVVCEVHHKHPWEFHFALVGTNKVQTLGYKSILGSCDLAQWLWRYGHSKSVLPLQQFCTFH